LGNKMAAPIVYHPQCRLSCTSRPQGYSWIYRPSLETFSSLRRKFIGGFRRIRHLLWSERGLHCCNQLSMERLWKVTFSHFSSPPFVGEGLISEWAGFVSCGWNNGSGELSSPYQTWPDPTLWSTNLTLRDGSIRDMFAENVPLLPLSPQRKPTSVQRCTGNSNSNFPIVPESSYLSVSLLSVKVLPVLVRRLRLMGKYIEFRIIPWQEADYTFWTDRTPSEVQVRQKHCMHVTRVAYPGLSGLCQFGLLEALSRWKTVAD